MTLLSGFETREVAVGDDTLHVRTAGEGPPVLLLHGYPQTSLMWHAVAPALAGAHTVVLVDLPGYGRSSAPLEGPMRYAKRRMAADVAAVMGALGHSRFAVVGHDRGARVGYRLALDAPERVSALAVLDIVPTAEVWETFGPARGMSYYHWLFLAQPHPFPEDMIGRDPVAFLNYTLASWTAARDLSAFHPDALADYRRAFSEPARIRATCDDYRAGASLDWGADRESRVEGLLIEAPTLVVWGERFHAGGGTSPLDTWQHWAPGAVGAGLGCGHFVAEEAPEETLALLSPFLARHAGG
jgi:haloacetate dehalogenase